MCEVKFVGVSAKTAHPCVQVAIFAIQNEIIIPTSLSLVPPCIGDVDVNPRVRVATLGDLLAAKFVENNVSIVKCMFVRDTKQKQNYRFD